MEQLYDGPGSGLLALVGRGARLRLRPLSFQRGTRLRLRLLSFLSLLTMVSWERAKLRAENQYIAAGAIPKARLKAKLCNMATGTHGHTKSIVRISTLAISHCHRSPKYVRREGFSRISNASTDCLQCKSGGLQAASNSQQCALLE